MSVTLDPTFPADSQSPRLGAADIRGLTSEVLQVFGESGVASVTYTLVPFKVIDHTTGLVQVQGVPTATLGIATKGYGDNATGSTWVGTAAGTNTYTVTPTSAGNAAAFTTLAAAVGELFLITFTNGNTGAATLNVSALGAKPIVNLGAALTSGQIAAGAVLLLSYDGTSFNILGGVTNTNPGGTIGEVRNFNAASNGGVKTIPVTADQVLMRSPSTGTAIESDSLSATIDISTVGPAVNGRDQAGAFTPSTFVHLYAIGGVGQTTGLIASNTAPPTGPTLPTNYTHWAYLTTFRLDGLGNVYAMRFRGNKAYYGGADIASQALVTANGTNGIDVSSSYSSYVPNIALTWWGMIKVTLGSTNANATIIIRQLASIDYATFYMFRSSGGNDTLGSAHAFELPTTSGNFSWEVDPNTGTTLTWIYAQGYTVPNNA